MIPSKSFDISIDRDQLANHLSLLGYRRGSTAYLRAFYHKDDPRKASDQGKKAEAKNLDQLVGFIQEWQAEGRGVYFVVNGGGHTDKDVTQCRAIFYEHDDLDKEISRELWRSLGLPEPTFQVDTGGKSIHSYWVFDEEEHVSPMQWKALQTDLLEYADADRALKNPSRVMRLAGAYHISPKGAFPSAIIAARGAQYSFGRLRAIVPTPQKQILPSVSPLSIGDDIPLSECLRVADRDFIANGAPEGTRNDTGAALARNLIGTAARLQYLNERYSGDPRQLFDNYCVRCSPPLGAKEADQIWKSAQSDNPTATLTDDAIINCIKSWKWRQQALYARPAQNNVCQIKTPVEVSLKERVSEIVSRGLSSSDEKLALLELSKQVNIQAKEIEVLANLLRQDLEVEESRDERKQEITKLLTVSATSLDLANFMPQQLADPLKLWCRWLNIPQSVALTAVLTTVSTLHPVGTELVIHRGMDFSVPPILFCGVVGESGQKKSPVYKTLIKKPLRVLQNEAKQEYERALKQYKSDLAEWEKAPGEGPKPDEPGLPIYFFTDATGEGIKSQAQQTPDKAMFALIDELAGLFNSVNQYRGGKGSDKQDMLSYYDGLGQTVLRSAGIKVDVERIYVSIFGGIQPDVLKEHTQDLKDADGHWARFLFVTQPLAASELPEDESTIDLRELLSGYYRRVTMIPRRQYKLSRKAFKRYQAVYNQLEQKRVSHPQPGMRAVYSKMEGAIGRLALNLHVLSMAVDNAYTGDEISLETMNKAIALAEFYIEQIKALHADSKADKGELSALLAKLLELARSKGRLSTSAANQAIRAIKSNSQALDYFRELEAMGYGRVEKDKKSWIFHPDAIVDIVDGIVDGIIDGSNSNKIKPFSPIVDIVDTIDDFAEKEPPPSSPGLKDPIPTNPPCEAKKTESDAPVYDVYDVYDEPESLTDKGKTTVDIIVDAPVYDVYDAALTPLDNSSEEKTEENHCMHCGNENDLISDENIAPIAHPLLEFDPLGNAQLMRELLAEGDAGKLLYDLASLWTDEQKSATRAHLEKSEVEAIRRVICEFMESCPDTSANEPQALIKIGDQVEWIGDPYNGASGCRGEVADMDLSFGFCKILWTRPDGSSFERREDPSDSSLRRRT